jgi:hypothetical protein
MEKINKTNSIKIIKEWLSLLKDDEILKDKTKENFMRNFYSKSQKYQESLSEYSFLHFKKKRNPDWPSTYCWFVVNSKLIETSISPKFDEYLNKEYQVKIAFRFCVSDLIINYRNSLNWGNIKCYISGEVLYQENCHIDHYNLTFKEIIKKWMDINNYTFDFLYQFVVRKNSRSYFTDENLTKSFIDFHNNNTNLRPILKSLNKCNLNS